MIVRTAAEGKNTAELHEDLSELTETWKTIQQNLKGAAPPAKILSEQTKTTSILRDLLNEDFNRIVTNDKNIFTEPKAISSVLLRKKPISFLFIKMALPFLISLALPSR